MVSADEYFMKQALKEAERARDEEEVPIGAVIVMQNKIIARGYNQVQKLNDSTAHAEIIALTSAFNFLGSKYLPEAILYVTLEPCMMCVGALYWSKIGKVVFGANDEKHGALMPQEEVTSPLVILQSPERRTVRLHPKSKIISGICAGECAALLTNFFKNKRQSVSD